MDEPPLQLAKMFISPLQLEPLAVAVIVQSPLSTKLIEQLQEHPDTTTQSLATHPLLSVIVTQYVPSVLTVPRLWPPGMLAPFRVQLYDKGLTQFEQKACTAQLLSKAWAVIVQQLLLSTMVKQSESVQVSPF